MTIEYMEIKSPVGTLVLGAENGKLTHCLFADGRDPIPTGWRRAADNAVLDEAAGQLGEYFDGARSHFTVPLDPRGTPFQRRVWEALLTIPCGATVTYGDIARQIGEPTSVRAVGTANGSNPIAVIIPCHRVIGANGKLVGYGGGLPRKSILLEHEARWALDLAPA